MVLKELEVVDVATPRPTGPPAVFNIVVDSLSESGLSLPAGRKDIIEFGQTSSALDPSLPGKITHLVALAAHASSRPPIQEGPSKSNKPPTAR